MTRTRPAAAAGALTVTCLFCGRLLHDLRDVHIIAIDVGDNAAAVACECCHALLLPTPSDVRPVPAGHA